MHFQEAHQIARFGERKALYDKFEVYKVFATSSASHLGYLMSEYESITGRSVKEAIERDFSGDAKHLLLGIGVRDKDLIRLLVSRAEIDLAEVQVEYERLFKQSLLQVSIQIFPAVIREECKGAYRDALLGIVKGNRSLN
ncbi:unnamed protein product [Angiostrongylus costaricensis]|uniref:Annexin n=1 Tax=Angiostrongylus costaricensis TaxID=334426 RepID=A0A0R3PEJ6_ANGCS|nr:unnamed protein product [Angiostrongylus costaricensis]